MSEEKKLAKVYHFDLYGKRKEKYDMLSNTDFDQVPWKELNPTSPYYFFVPKDFDAMEKYEKGFSVTEIFRDFNSGIKTDRDKLFIDFNKTDLISRFQKLLSGSYDKFFIEEYNIKDSGSFKITKKIFGKQFSIYNILSIQYRILDYRYIYYDKDIVSRPGYKIFKYIVDDNQDIYLLTSRNFSKNFFNRIFVSNKLVDIHCASDQTYCFPLYLYNQNNLDQTEEKVANFNMETISKIEEKLGLKYIGLDSETSSEGQENLEGQNGFTAQDLFDYIYAVLHSKSYREKFQEFLKIDFPKIPFDVDKETFFKFVKLGGELRKYHLMEHKDIKAINYFTSYPIEGNNLVEKIVYKDNKVFINESQYFENVPKEIWEFYIGGYQPAQKWLKDRKGRMLNSEDVEHYIKIVFVLKKTIDLMEEIEKIYKF